MLAKSSVVREEIRWLWLPDRIDEILYDSWGVDELAGRDRLAKRCRMNMRELMVETIRNL